MNVVVAGKYRLEKKIGSGAFGEIYLCTCLEDNKPVAIKIEKMGTRHPQLLYESRVVKQLFGAPGLPTVLHSGVHDETNVMVMDLLGPSLEELLTICSKKMSLKTVLMLADQILCRLHYIHSKNYIHRDVKPENFLIGMGRKCSILHVVDFGLAKQYRNPKSHRHIPYRDGKSLTGTARYASLNTHLGIEQSRRDDIEGFAYLVIYLLKGSLPWQGIQATTKDEKYRKIQERKMSIPIPTLCAGLPDEIGFLVQYARGLTFEQKPDYSFLRRTVKSLFLKQGFEYDYVYDWTDSVAYSAMVAKRSLAEVGHRRSPMSEHEPSPHLKRMSPDTRDTSCAVF